MQISIIIINYNTDALTLQAVASVFRYVKDVSFEIIVVDNNSKETRLDSDLASYPNTYFYRLEKNIGFGKANNYGYSKSKGKYVFLLNSDAYLIDKNTVSTFIDYLEGNENVGCVGGNLFTANGEPNISYGNFLSIEKMMHDYGLKKRTKDYYVSALATSKVCDFKKPAVVDYLTAAAIMIKRDVIEKLGLFDTRYFMYFEDMDLCYRYKKNGYISVLLPNVKIVHIGGQSGLNNSQNNVLLYKEIHRSKYLFLQNVTNGLTAYTLFQLGKIIPVFTKIKRKIKIWGMDKSKRIAIYSNAWDATGGGGIVYVLAIAKILSKKGFDVTVFFNDKVLLREIYSRYEASGLKIKILKRKAMPLFSQIYFALMERMHFDAVILQSLSIPRLTFVKKSFILCDFPNGKVETISERVRLKSWKNIMVNSEYTKDWVRNYWKREATVFYPPIEIPTSLNQTRNLDLVCIGRFNNGKRSKRQDIVIAVFKDLIAMGYAGINLHVLGYVQDEGYLNKLKETAVGFPVFFYGNCPNLKRVEILNQSALFISACGYENNENAAPMLVEHYGISVVEAMSQGCIPVVVGKGGHNETVDHGKNGYHWNTKEELQLVLIKLLENKELRAEMRAEAYLKSRQYSFDKLEETLLQTFSEY